MNTQSSSTFERYPALDIHKHYVVVGGVNAQQQVVLPLHRLDLGEWAVWSAKHLRPTDALVLKATTNPWTFFDQVAPHAGRTVVAHPGLVKMITSARVKTDNRDVLHLARLVSIRITLLRGMQSAHRQNAETQCGLRVSCPNESECAESGSANCALVPRPSAVLSSVHRAWGLSFFSARTNMCCESKLCQKISHLLKIIALIQAHALWLFVRGRGTLGHHVLNRCTRQFHIMAIRTRYRQTDGHTVPFHQETTLDAALPAISWVCAAFFPRPAGLSSWHRPYSATPNPCLSIRQSVRRRTARISKRHQQLPILESACAPSNPNRDPFHPALSTDSPSARHRKFHRHICGLAHVAVCRRSDGYSCESVATVGTQSIVCRLHESWSWFGYSAYADASVWV